MTVDGKRRELSLSKYRPESWDQNKQRGQLRGNHQVKQNACVGRIYLAEQELVNGHIKVTIESLMNKYTGVEVKTHTYRVFEYENKRIKKLVALGHNKVCCCKCVKIT
jgi:hypothetical protein